MGSAVIPDEAAEARPEWTSNVTRLVRRVTYGITAGEVSLARSMGYQGYLNHQLNHTRIDDSAVETHVAAAWPELELPGTTLSGQSANIHVPLQQSTIYRAAFSKRQLYHRMVEFWTDHFAIDINKVSYLKLVDDREVIRRHALGKFGDLLRASARSPAMLLYLDQNLSRAGNPNQNYARELLELHTVGVDNGYTQEDVDELARVLTGWTVLPRGGGFTFSPTIHDWTMKRVMGITIPASSPTTGTAGINEGLQIIDMLIDHPNTARYLATKMLRWLLTPTPSPAQINTVASVYKATKGDIKSMVRVILNEQWVSQAPVKFKRPFHLLVSALRSVRPTITAMTGVNTQLSNIGQPLFFWETPDGYPDTVEYWAGNILPRWSFVNTFAANGVTGLSVDTAPYLAGSRDAAVDLIDQNCFGGEMPASTRGALLEYVRAPTTLTAARVRDTIGLALSSAAFQWY